MGYRDLRSFLDALEREGQLIHYSEPVKLEPDISDISRSLTPLGHYAPAVMFDNIIGYKGQRVVVGVHGSMANYAMMFGHSKHMQLREQITELSKIWDDYPKGKVEWVENAPCQEVVVEGEDVNLYDLIPAYRINPLDGGFYLPKSSIVTREPYDPDNFNTQNVGTYRVQLQGPRQIGMNISAMHDSGDHIAQAAALNQPLPIAICLGVDPMLTIMSSTPLKYNESEYVYASALNGGEPYQLTKTIGYNLDVPANAEFIIEGEVVPNKCYPEGPFGEFPGSYSGVTNGIRVVVKRVTHRKNPIFDSLYLGGRGNTESACLTVLNTCVPLYKQLKESFPQVKAVNATYQHGMTTIVSTDQRSPGFAKTIAMRLASTPHGTDYCRNIIMVDGDVDPFNLTEVMWALSTRVRADVDVIEIKGTPGVPLIPADLDPLLGRKLIIDATTPVPPDKFRPSKLVKPFSTSKDYGDVIAKMQQEIMQK